VNAQHHAPAAPLSLSLPIGYEDKRALGQSECGGDEEDLCHWGRPNIEPIFTNYRVLSATRVRTV